MIKSLKLDNDFDISKKNQTNYLEKENINLQSSLDLYKTEI